MTANFNKNSSGCKCQSDSTIQKASRGTEKGGSKTNQSQRSQRVESRENFKQKKNKRSRKVSSTMEGVYGGI